MDAVEMIREGINAARLSPESVARADAAITRSIGSEIARAVRITQALHEGERAVFADDDGDRVFAMKQTRKWEHLSNDARRTIEAAVRHTDSFEDAAVMIEALGNAAQ